MSTSNTQTAQSGILAKIEEVREVFQYGERLLPLLDDFFLFMKEIIPLLDHINNSIEESSAKLPRASTELNSVTKATESATIEILDIIDAMTRRIDDARADLQNVRSNLQNRADRAARILAETASLPAASATASLRDLLTSLTEAKETTTLEGILATLDTLSAYAGDITITLQVQDITAQQLAAVNHLVRSVHERLSILLQSFDKSEIRVIQRDLHETYLPTAFDPNATWRKGDADQNTVDRLLDEHFSGGGNGRLPVGQEFPPSPSQSTTATGVEGTPPIRKDAP